MSREKSTIIDGRRDRREDEMDLSFTPRDGDRRQNETISSQGGFYTRKVGDRIVAGKERRKRDRRSELIDTTLITLTNEDGSKYRVL